MNYSYLWLTLGLACLLVLVLLSSATCLFLVRRLDGLSQAHDATEQRVIQLAYELRRLERLTDGLARRRGIATSSDAEEDLENSEPPPLTPLISVPDLGFEGGPQDFAGLAKKHGEIWALVDAGRTPNEIAQETGRPIGQVELIVGLYWQHHDSHKQGRHDGLR